MRLDKRAKLLTNKPVKFFACQVCVWMTQFKKIRIDEGMKHCIAGPLAEVSSIGRRTHILPFDQPSRLSLEAADVMPIGE